MTVIKVKNSNVAGRLPAAGDLQPAELALNLADKKLYSKDVAGTVFEIGVAGDVPTGNTPPVTGNNNGDLFFDTSSNELKYWSGSAWETVTVEPADGNGYVDVGGDTMTGQLTLPGGGTGAEALQADEVTALISNPDGPADGNYLKLVAGTFDQSVQSTGTTDFAGDVTVGDDKITLEATGGSAEFAGPVTATSNNVLGNGNLILRHPDRLKGNLGQLSVRDKDGNIRANIGFTAGGDTAAAEIYFYTDDFSDVGDTGKATACFTANGFNIGGVVNPNLPGDPNIVLNKTVVPRSMALLLVMAEYL